MRLAALLLTSAILATPVVAAEPKPAAAPVRVAVYADEGALKKRGSVADGVDEMAGFKAELVTAADIRAGKLKDFKVVIQPGGSGSVQGKALGEEGRAAIKGFVKGGGGYVGICAGSYLASRTYDWSLHILDAEVVDRAHWARGTGEVVLDLKPTGKDFFGRKGDDIRVYYGQGPLLAPGKDPAIPDYEELASYATEIHSKGGAQPGVMKGTTAAARGTFGGGRVFCWSPHPEKTDPTHDLFHKAVAWAAGK